jgi:hypothetical protein
MNHELPTPSASDPAHRCARHRAWPLPALAGLLAVLLGGCSMVVAVNPLYTPADQVTDNRLIGTWVNHDTAMQIGANGYWYDITLSDATAEHGEQIKMRARLIDLRGTTFIDVYPAQPGETLCLSCVPMHLLARLSIDDQSLRITPFDADWLERRAKDQVPVVRAHEPEGESSTLILLAETPRLRDFIESCIDEPGAYAVTDKGADLWSRRPGH